MKKRVRRDHEGSEEGETIKKGSHGDCLQTEI
jgi:hypothetical protein